MFKSSTGTPGRLGSPEATQGFSKAPFRRRALGRVAAAVALGFTLATTLMPAPTWSQAAPSEIQATAPDRYTVKHGDTLWDISSQYLKEPWRWPKLWRMNQEQIRNPHLIYPGQVLLFDPLTGTLSVAAEGSGNGNGSGASGAPGGRESLHPRIRREDEADAVPSIPPNVIEPFLARPLVIQPHEFDGAPRVIATEEGHTAVAAGQRIYASGLPNSSVGTDWQIYRRGRPLIDPDTKKPIADEAIYVATARVVKNGEPASLFVRSAVMEITAEDRLVPQPPAQLLNYVPHAPTSDVEARVIGIYPGRGEQSSLGSGLDENRKDVSGFDARREAGPLQVVSINRGSADGLEMGHVLALYRTTWVKHDHSIGPWYMGDRRPADIQLPEERYGLLFVFRTFDHISYALIVQGQRPVMAGDYARKP